MHVSTVSLFERSGLPSQDENAVQNILGQNCSHRPHSSLSFHSVMICLPQPTTPCNVLVSSRYLQKKDPDNPENGPGQ